MARQLLCPAGMLHPHTTLRHVDDSIGFGVFATQPIPAGTITWVLDDLDQLIALSDLERLSADQRRCLEVWGYQNAAGDYVLCWDFARLINHSCEPNILSPGLDLELAVRDIAAGEQLVSDYGAYNIEAAFSCGCGADSCRVTIQPDDFDHLYRGWDERLRAIAPAVVRVPQPLWSIVREPAALHAAARDPQRLPSSATHRMATTRPSDLRRVGTAGASRLVTARSSGERGV